MYIDLPIEARSIFRILSIRQIVESDVLASRLCDKLPEILSSIPMTMRLLRSENCSDYLNYSKNHTGSEKASCSLSRMGEEELCFCKEGLFRSGCGDIGDVFDYQIPLASSQDKGEGVVDLLSRQGDNVFVLEVKKWVSDEHPIRAMMEVLTFWKMMVDECTIQCPNASTFVRRYNNSKKRNIQLGLDTILIPAILISDSSKIYRKMMEDPLSNAFKALYMSLVNDCNIRCFRYGVRHGDIYTYEFTSQFVDRLS